MEWYEIKVDGRKSVKFPEKLLPSHNITEKPSSYANKLGGIIKKGEWGWLAKDATLQIVSLKYGHTVSTFEFAESKGYDNCVIRCADQVFPNEPNGVYLAVCLESMNSSGGSFVAIYSVDHSTVLSCMEVKLRVNCCRFMESTVCRRSLLQNFNGCLALGSMEGVIVLLDLNMAKVLAMNENLPQDEVFIPCHVIDYNMPLREIHRNFKQCQQDGVHFGLQMEVMDAPCSVHCLLPIDLTLSLAVGLEDGRLVVYDLTELQIFYVVTAEQHGAKAPLVKIDFLEPPDDPRPCLYIWALHEGDQNLTAVLHSLMYEKRVIDHNVDNFCFLEIFQTSCIRLMLSLESSKSTAISCQSITRSTVHGEDDANCLCVFTWFAVNEHKNKLVVFDLNQWYKEEMPYSIDSDRDPNYLAAYVLNGQQCALQSFINPATIAHFNSLQRFEEHFYPSSLSFDCALLMRHSCLSYNWEGAQNRFINILRSSNASIFLEPNTYFNEILRTRLMPQFCDLNAKSTFSKNAKYEIILSVALEYSCYSLLRDCAKCWVDGSFMGNLSTTTGITLSTLTDWAWKRATDIKTRCNDLCKGLFDFGGYPLDQREQKELGFISRQLKLLAYLQHEVLTFSKQHTPEKVHNTLELKYKSLRMASDYQDILLWLLNIGLLPEASPYSSKVNHNHELVPYPYKLLKELYTKKRVFFGKISDNLVSKKTGSCRLLYIDAFIEHECKGNVLREYWQENNGDGLYPPISIEAMLRIMLVPDMSYDSKCAIMLYFFLDLNMTINDEAYKNVVANFIKFPSVFKLSASLIKTVQAFWNLDHCHFLPAVDEFISPFNKNQNYPEWLLELLIETLLTQNAANLALRILEARSSLISPILKMQTLLANELISEAFHFARSKQDDALLEQFFKCCLCNGKFGVIRDLALSEKEGQLVQDILKNSKTENAENLHFVYLLQKSKYIEAVSYMDEISKSKCMRSNLNSSTAMNTPNLVMAAYNTTMTPVTQGLTDVYFRIKNKIRRKETDNKSPVPLSCQLIKQNANKLLGGIYHSSALSAHFATYYWGEMENEKSSSEECNSLLSSNNAPFLRKAQIETNFLDFGEKNAISYPRTYKVIEKRTLAESEILETGEYEKLNSQENPKKRRKLVGAEIVQDLSNVMQVTKNTPRLNNINFLTQPSPSSLETEMLEKEVTNNFLTQPPSLKARFQPNEVIANNTVKSLASSEIHSILKTNTPEPIERHSVRRDLLVEEEAKNIRFDLPSSESEHEDPAVRDQTAETKVITKAQIVVPLHNEPKKIVARSVSVDSCNSLNSTDSSKAPSEEHFYSPISSHNNSLAVESNLNDTKNSALTTPHRLSIAEGPKARKPLTRLSTERTEKSKSPEPRVIETGCTKERSPNLKPEVPKIIAEPLPAVVNSLRTNKFLTLDTRNSGILYENMSAPIVISSVESLASNIKEFIPQVSSSKVSETQSKFSIERTETHMKISEHSTVVGSLTYMESNIETSKQFARPEVNPTKMATKLPTTEELDTTLGMSSYDFTLLDSTTVQPTKSYLQQNIASTAIATAEASCAKIKNEALSTDGNIYADLETDAKMESDHESDMLFDVAMGLQDKLKNEPSTSLEAYKKNNKVENNVIVLLSSEDEEDELNKSGTNNEDSDSSVSINDYKNGKERAGEESEYSATSPEYDDYDENENEDSYENVVEEEAAGEGTEISGTSPEYDDDISIEELSDDDEDDNEAETDARKQNQSETSDASLLEVESDETDSEEYDQYEVEVNDVEEVKNKLKLEEERVVESKNVDNIPSEEKQNTLQNSFLGENKRLRVGSESSEDSSESEEESPLPMEETRSEQNEKTKQILTVSNKAEAEDQTKLSSANEMKETQPSLTCAVVIDDKYGKVDNIKFTEVEPVVVDIEQVEVEPTTLELKVTETEKSPASEKDSVVENSAQSKEEISRLKELEKSKEKIERTEKSPASEKESVSKNSAQSKEEISPLKNLEKSKEQISPSKEMAVEKSNISFSPQKNRKLEQPSNDDNDDNDEASKKLENTTKGGNVGDEDNKTNIAQQTIETPPDNPNVEQIEDGKTNTPQQSVETPRGKSTIFEAAEDDQAKNNKNENKQTDHQSTEAKVEFEMKQRPDKNNKSETSADTSKKGKEAAIKSPIKPRGIRAGSVPATTASFKANIATSDGSLTPKSRITRRMSVDEQGSTQLTPRTRRSLRATSMQPIQLKEEVEEEVDASEPPQTPIRTQRDSVPRGRSVPHTTDDTKHEQTTRGTSQPPPGAAAKITGRRRSTLLDVINESPNVLDSPSTRTRSRLRLNSMDSELDISLVASEQPPEAKRTRKISTSSNISEQPTSTPTKRSRRNSFTTAQSEAVTPKTLRSRSVITVQEESAITTNTLTTKRKKSSDENLNETIIKESPEEEEEAVNTTENNKSLTGLNAEKHESQPTTSSYSLSRRLTRTQLAMLEKSAALAGVSIHDLAGSSGTQVSSSSPKRVTRRRTSQSTAASHHESDDAESVVSHRSNKSNSAATRRVTRSSVKDKDEVDDDIISVISSVGSEKTGKRRSNESKNSPSSQLPAIPEDETDEHNVEPNKPKTRRTKR